MAETQDIGSCSVQRPKRELLMKAARRREIDIITGVAAGSLGTFGRGSRAHAEGTE